MPIDRRGFDLPNPTVIESHVVTKRYLCKEDTLTYTMTVNGVRGSTQVKPLQDASGYAVYTRTIFSVVFIDEDGNDMITTKGPDISVFDNLD